MAAGSTRPGSTSRPRIGRGHGHIRIRDGKIWTLLTTLKELKGHEEHKGTTRPQGVAHVLEQGRKTWAEERAEEQAKLGYEIQPEVLIIGGGQGGIALGARLRQLGVPTIIIEKNARARRQLAQPLQVALPA